MVESDFSDPQETDDETPISTRTPQPLPHGARRPCLVVLAGSRLGEVLPIDGPDGLVVGRDPKAELQLVEDGVSRQHARFTFNGTVAEVEDLESTNGTWVNGVRIRRHQLQVGEKIRVGQLTILKFTYQDPIEERYQRQLFEAALRDGLTRAYNHRYFQQRIVAEMAYADRHHTPLGLLLLDVDYFRVINSVFGYVVGDAVLQRLAEILQSQTRLDDILARYGGEEFAVVARGTPFDACLGLAERLRSAVVDGPFADMGRPIEVRVSIGIAAVPFHTIADAKGLVSHAVEALGQAKRGGRNRIAF